MAKYTKDNREEIPDPTPVELPLGYTAPEPLMEMIKRLIQVESYNASRNGDETFEEADDFEVDDDGELVSEYEVKEMSEEYYDDRQGDVEKAVVAPAGAETSGSEKITSKEPDKVAQ